MTETAPHLRAVVASDTGIAALRHDAAANRPGAAATRRTHGAVTSPRLAAPTESATAWERTMNTTTAIVGQPPPTRRESAPVYAVIPAHDEADEIGATLTSLIRQVPADRIVVACDNCTDETEAIAATYGVRTLATVDNRDKKAGALNQALHRLLAELPDDGLVLILDADTTMNERFVDTAVRWLQADPGIGAVGGIFTGRDPHGLLQRCQANEYVRYAREIERTRRVMVLTGTASLIRVTALREVAAARGDSIPGLAGDVYDRNALTEDMELTLALLSLGWSLAAPSECTVETQLMPTVKALHQQRLRWYRGALDNLATYGWGAVTARYFLQQVMLLIGSAAMMLYLTLTALDLAFGLVSFSWFWMLVGALFAAERVVTCWAGGVKARLMAAVLVIELAYDVLLQLAFLRALAQTFSRAERAWHHNTSPSSGGKK